MNQIATINPSQVANIEAIDTPTLKTELARALTLSAQHLSYLGKIWMELERRGEDLSELRTGLAVYLPLIGAGQLDAAVVVKFAGQKTLLRAIATLPLYEQKRIAEGGTVQTLVLNETGEYMPRDIPANALTAMQARYVFDDGRIRSIDEQRSIIDSARTSAARRQRPTQSDKIKIDRKTGGLRVGRTAVSIGELLSALAELSSPAEDIPEKDQAKLVISVSKDELKAIKIHAAEGDSTMQKLVRGVLAASGLLSR
jgi:hypothetical protein